MYAHGPDVHSQGADLHWPKELGKAGQLSNRSFHAAGFCKLRLHVAPDDVIPSLEALRLMCEQFLCKTSGKVQYASGH